VDKSTIQELAPTTGPSPLQSGLNTVKHMSSSKLRCIQWVLVTHSNDYLCFKFWKKLYCAFRILTNQSKPNSESQNQNIAWCRMTVVEGWFGGIKYDRVPAAAELHAAELDLIEVNAAVNSQVKFIAATGTS